MTFMQAKWLLVIEQNEIGLKDDRDLKYSEFI